MAVTSVLPSLPVSALLLFSILHSPFSLSSKFFFFSSLLLLFSFLLPYNSSLIEDNQKRTNEGEEMLMQMSTTTTTHSSPAEQTKHGISFRSPLFTGRALASCIISRLRHPSLPICSASRRLTVPPPVQPISVFTSGYHLFPSSVRCLCPLCPVS